jgi:hypothetical protein
MIGIVSAQQGPEGQGVTAILRAQLGNADLDFHVHDPVRDPFLVGFERNLGRLTGLAIANFDLPTRTTLPVDEHAQGAAVLAARRGIPLFAQTPVTPDALGVTQYTSEVVVFGTTDVRAIAQRLEARA